VLTRRRGYGVYQLVGLSEENKGPPHKWLTVNNDPAFAYSEDGADGGVLYSVVAEMDGRKVNLAVSYKEKEFTFLGAVPEAKDGRVPLPGFLPVEKGDTITLLYPKIDTRRPGHEEEFFRSAQFTVDKPMEFSFSPAEGKAGLMLTDCYNNEYVTDIR
jgi:hypothetical protein